jgi:hypothetical protein
MAPIGAASTNTFKELEGGAARLEKACAKWARAPSRIERMEKESAAVRISSRPRAQGIVVPGANRRTAAFEPT